MRLYPPRKAMQAYTARAQTVSAAVARSRAAYRLSDSRPAPSGPRTSPLPTSYSPQSVFAASRQAVVSATSEVMARQGYTLSSYNTVAGRPALNSAMTQTLLGSLPPPTTPGERRPDTRRLSDSFSLGFRHHDNHDL